MGFHGLFPSFICLRLRSVDHLKNLSLLLCLLQLQLCLKLYLFGFLCSSFSPKQLDLRLCFSSSFPQFIGNFQRVFTRLVGKLLRFLHLFHPLLFQTLFFLLVSLTTRFARRFQQIVTSPFPTLSLPICRQCLTLLITRLRIH